MAFQKIDEDAVIGDQPFDSFLLKGIHANIKEAYLTRPRRGAVSFAYDIRPQYGCFGQHILPLCVFPISQGATFAHARIFFDVLDDDVRLQGVLLSEDGTQILWESDAETLNPGYDQFLDITYNVTGLTSFAILGLSIDSTIDETSKVTIGTVSTDFTVPTTGRFVFDDAVAELDPDKRQLVRLVNFSDSTLTDQGPYNVIQIATDKRSFRVWSRPQANFNLNGEFVSYDIELVTMGSIKISGMCFKESFDNADLEVGDAIDPGYRPSSSVIQNLIGLEKQFFLERTTIHHIGPSVCRFDLDSYFDTYSKYGTRVVANDNTWRNIGNDIFLAKDTDQIVSNSTTYNRRNCTVVGLIDCGIDRNSLSEERPYESLSVQVRAANYTFDTGDEKWNGDPETYEQSGVSVRIRNGGSNYIYPPYGTFFLGLYRRSNFTDIPNEGAERGSPPNFSLFIHRWDDEYDERRRFQIHVSGNPTTIEGVNIVGYNCFAYIPTYTVFTSTGETIFPSGA